MLLLLVILFYLLLVLVGCVQPALHVAEQTVHVLRCTLRLTTGELKKNRLFTHMHSHWRGSKLVIIPKLVKRQQRLSVSGKRSALLAVVGER